MKCIQLLKLIEKMVKAGKLDHLIKDAKDKPKNGNRKDKAETILMIQNWQRKTRQKVSQTFSCEKTISFPPLNEHNIALRSQWPITTFPECMSMAGHQRRSFTNIVSNDYDLKSKGK